MGEHFPFRGHDLSMDRFGNPHWSILLRLKKGPPQLVASTFLNRHRNDDSSFQIGVSRSALKALDRRFATASCPASQTG